MKIRYLAGLVLCSAVITLDAWSMMGALNDARKSVKKALNKASGISFNDLIGRKTPKPMVITPELLRGLGSPTSYEYLQKADELYRKLFWAEQYDLVAALDLISKTKAPESRTMLRTMLKQAMVDHAQNQNPSTLEFIKELVAEETILAQILTELMRAVDGLKNDASVKAAAIDVKGLHERRNKDLATLRTLTGLVAELSAI